MVATLMTVSSVLTSFTSTPSTRRVSDLFSMNTVAMGRPIWSRVRFEKRLAPFPSRVMKTAGDPFC
jgi:hypothetical protein